MVRSAPSRLNTAAISSREIVTRQPSESWYSMNLLYTREHPTRPHLPINIHWCNSAVIIITTTRRDSHHTTSELSYRLLPPRFQVVCPQRALTTPALSRPARKTIGFESCVGGRVAHPLRPLQRVGISSHPRFDGDRYRGRENPDTHVERESRDLRERRASVSTVDGVCRQFPPTNYQRSAAEVRT